MNKHERVLFSEMKLMLSSLEWCIIGMENQQSCPYCGYNKSEGHDLGCELGELMIEIGGSNDE